MYILVPKWYYIKPKFNVNGTLKGNIPVTAFIPFSPPNFSSSVTAGLFSRVRLNAENTLGYGFVFSVIRSNVILHILCKLPMMSDFYRFQNVQNTFQNELLLHASKRP